MFNKVGSALKRAREGIAAITHAASELMISSQESSARRPAEELLKSFKEFCSEVDRLAEADELVSADDETALVDTNVCEQLSTIIELLRKESWEWSLCGRGGDSLAEYDDSKLQCLEVFVENHMMHEICMRAIRDIPKGCMPLVLNATALLLQSVRYPLLVQQTIHKPIANLISIAARFDALKHTVPSATGSRTTRSEKRGSRSSLGLQPVMRQNKQHLVSQVSSPAAKNHDDRSSSEDSYKQEVDTGLLSLIHILWLKIRENPVVLDFFTVLDNRVLVRENNRPRMQPQMDVLVALVGLVDRGNTLGVSVSARKSLLIAVAMRDLRVDAFIMAQTSLVETMLRSLGERFYCAIEVLVKSRKTSMLHGVDSTGDLNPQGSYSYSYSASLRPPSTLPDIAAHGDASKDTMEITESMSSAKSIFSSLGILSPSNNRNKHATGAVTSTPGIYNKHPETVSSLSSCSSEGRSQYRPLDEMTRAFRFCDSFAAACACSSSSYLHTAVDNHRIVSEAEDAAVDRGLDYIRTTCAGIIGETSAVDHPHLGITPIREVFLRSYEELFMEKCIRGAIMANGEHHVVATSSLVRYLLGGMRRRAGAGPLLASTVHFLCRTAINTPGTGTSPPHNTFVGATTETAETTTTNGSVSGPVDIIPVLISRAGSSHKPISVSGMMLLSVILKLADLEDCIQVLKIASFHQSPKSVQTGQPIASGEFNAASCGVTTTDDDVHVDELLRKVVEEIPEEIRRRSYDGDDSAQPPLQALPNSNLSCYPHARPAGRSKPPHTAIYADIIFSKLAGKLSVLSPPPRPCFVYKKTADRQHTITAARSSIDTATKGAYYESALLEMLQKKLSVFLTLKFDEQIALSGLTEQCVSVLGAIAISRSAEGLEWAAEIPEVTLLLQLKSAIELQWRESQSLLQRVFDWQKKILACRQFLQATVGDYYHEYDTHGQQLCPNNGEPTTRSPAHYCMSDNSQHANKSTTTGFVGDVLDTSSSGGSPVRDGDKSSVPPLHTNGHTLPAARSDAAAWYEVIEAEPLQCRKVLEISVVIEEMLLEIYGAIRAVFLLRRRFVAAIQSTAHTTTTSTSTFNNTSAGPCNGTIRAAVEQSLEEMMSNSTRTYDDDPQCRYFGDFEFREDYDTWDSDDISRAQSPCLSSYINADILIPTTDKSSMISLNNDEQMTSGTSQLSVSDNSSHTDKKQPLSSSYDTITKNEVEFLREFEALNQKLVELRIGSYCDNEVLVV